MKNAFSKQFPTSAFVLHVDMPSAREIFGANQFMTFNHMTIL
jgi:hypothetical protein